MSISVRAASGIPQGQSPISPAVQKGAQPAQSGSVADQVELTELAVKLLQAGNAATANANIAQAAGQVSGAIVGAIVNVLG